MTSSKLTIPRIFAEPYLSGPYINDIGWSPNGKLMTYTWMWKNQCQLRGFDVEARKRRKLLDYNELEGTGHARRHRLWVRRGGRHIHPWRMRDVQPPAHVGYHWSPSGEVILVTTPEGGPRLLEVDGGRVSPLLPIERPIFDPKFSPDGRCISFVWPYDLYLVDLQSGRVAPVTSGSSETYKSAFPTSTGDVLWSSGHWWSPDSRHIAYLQTDESRVPYHYIWSMLEPGKAPQPQRYPRPGDPIPTIVVKVVSPGGRTILIDTRPWLDHYLARVSWLPDSRHLALQLLSRDQTRLVLVIADAQTGATRPILTEESPTWVNISDDLRFFADGRRFLWSSERDSYRQLYLYDISGQQLAQLTAGNEAAVTVEGLDEKNQAVYYLTFPEPYRAAQLKRVHFGAAAGGYRVDEPELLTSGPGSHFTYPSPDFAHFGDHVSTASQPPDLYLCDAAGKRLAPVEKNRAAEELASFDLPPFEFPEPIPAAKIGDPSDKMPLYTKLVKPRKIEKGKRYPVIVYVYGGPTPAPSHGLVSTALDYWQHLPDLWMQFMAQQGFGVFTLENRGTNEETRGHDWENPIKWRLGRVEMKDQLQGIEYLKSLDWVDPERLGILGGSFGGFLTLTAMLQYPGVFKAAVAYAPPTDWRDFDAVYTERYMGMPAENEEGYKKTAPVNKAGRLEGRLLLVHGTADSEVHLPNTVRIIDSLVQKSRQFDLWLAPGQAHYSFFEMGHQPEQMWQYISEFFEKNL